MPSKTEITETILSLREEWLENGGSPQSINEGECMEFVNQLFFEFEETSDLKRMTTEDIPESYVISGKETFKPEPYHEWLSDGTFHYDAECPDGVEDWKELPFFKRTLGL